jgi:D-alanyl-D-alanine carboxypeptidase/D-alanyl-D-alanine-endopeptidase (penicillin-binding protein 4)
MGRLYWTAVAMCAAAAVGGASTATYLALSGNGDKSDKAYVIGTNAPAPVLAASSEKAPVPTQSGLTAALEQALHSTALGGRLNYSIVDPLTNQTLLAGGADTASTPASTNKILTAAAALSTLGDDATFTTSVVAGPGPGDVVLVGGGDVTLAAGGKVGYTGAATLEDLAAQVKKAHPAAVTRVLVDDARYTGAQLGPGWETGMVETGNFSPLAPVMLNAGRVNLTNSHAARSNNSDLDAGRALAGLLGAPPAQVVRGAAGSGAKQLGAVHSPPLTVTVQSMLQQSDNVIAEGLAREVAIAQHKTPDFASGAAAIQAALAKLGLDTTGLHTVDGSGLSHGDAVPPKLLTQTVALAAGKSHPELRPVFAGLPVAGFSGTLDPAHKRFNVAATKGAAGIVRAKTGTLDGVNTLAGILTTSDGRLLAFAFMADKVRTGGGDAAMLALDKLATTLASCGCR